MARTTAEIRQSMNVSFMANSYIQSAYGFLAGSVFETEFSKVSFENILFDILAYCIYTLELVFDQHKSEIDTALYEQKSGTPRWYRNMSLAFQNGFDLLPDSDKFDNGTYTIDQIATSKIIKYCSVKESSESNRLIIKVAGETSSVLTPLTTTQLTSFAEYLKEIKYAGVKLSVINNPADLLRLNMQIYRDVLVLDEYGNSILNGGKPVEAAIESYMRNLPFDGELILNDLIAHLRSVDGVDNANITLAESSVYNSVTGQYSDYEAINVQTIPVAGYFKVPNFQTVIYVV